MTRKARDGTPGFRLSAAYLGYLTTPTASKKAASFPSASGALCPPLRPPRFASPSRPAPGRPGSAPRRRQAASLDPLPANKALPRRVHLKPNPERPTYLPLGSLGYPSATDRLPSQARRTSALRPDLLASLGHDPAAPALAHPWAVGRPGSR
jgi:hypothetical protein